MNPDVAIEVGIAPEGAAQRLAKAINRRPRRALGVFKTENEYVGVVRGDHFEIWERRQHAVHAVGRLRAVHGGSRIELVFQIPLLTRVLIAVFFALYILVAAGIALRTPDPDVSLEELVIGAGGAALLGILFAWAAVRQRTDLRHFIGRLFGESTPL